MAHDAPPDKFTDLLKKIARVPKREIDEREREYQKTREQSPPAKPGKIIQPPQKGVR